MLPEAIMAIINEKLGDRIEELHDPTAGFYQYAGRVCRF